MRILDYALALDGGTEVVVLATRDGEQISIGLDGRMNSPAGARRLFVGNPRESRETRMLPVGGAEEREMISLLEKWLEETQGFTRREALMEADEAVLEGQDLLHRPAMEFLMDVRNRDAVVRVVYKVESRSDNSGVLVRIPEPPQNP